MKTTNEHRTINEFDETSKLKVIRTKIRSIQLYQEFVQISLMHLHQE